MNMHGRDKLEESPQYKEALRYYVNGCGAHHPSALFSRPSCTVSAPKDKEMKQDSLGADRDFDNLVYEILAGNLTPEKRKQLEEKIMKQLAARGHDGAKQVVAKIDKEFYQRIEETQNAYMRNGGSSL